MVFFMAGTSDARDLAIQLKQQGHSLLASVVTESAARSLQEAGIEVRTGRLNATEMSELLRTTGAPVLVDASHPFAEEAHRTAMQAAECEGIPYVRYERAPKTYDHPRVLWVDTYQEAAEAACARPGSIMLTTGSKTLQVFTQVLLGLPDVRLVARLLPNVENMEKCARLGLEAKNIVGMQGPFSKEFNQALYRQYNTALMVTKESGGPGSMDEKVEAALDMGIDVIVIRRPKLAYGTCYTTFEGVVAQVERLTRPNAGDVLSKSVEG
ncbi:precorrin-6A reductase [Alicyclobacillus sp. ALC3]|uniref:precorrin-6A reductase n=1 Tax=Alicyclobacillus sp. ALC3 TaxID=2796143 RepID=UPI002379CEBC|nr:precorrin-6A reductase [Alicyclobacillus sp. ALC3]WDL96521.1 precorrin-6A reductase [Alicyclobacillus sp. ALC3]